MLNVDEKDMQVPWKMQYMEMCTGEHFSGYSGFFMWIYVNIDKWVMTMWSNISHIQYIRQIIC